MIKSRVSWTYKFFHAQRVGRIIRCRYQVKHANYWIPRAFTWTVPDQTPDLHAYIDAVTEQRATDAMLWEDNGKVVEVEREDAPVGVEMVRVDPTLLCAILRGEYVLDIPVTSRLVCSEDFKTKPRYIPVEAAAALIASQGVVKDAYVKKIREMAAAGEPLFYIPEPIAEGKLKEWGIQPYLPGMNRREAAAVVGARVSEEAPQSDAHEEQKPTPKEIEITSIDHGSHTEFIHMVVAKRNYYCRRLLRGTTQFWCGTSFTPTGPWRVFQEDPIVMAAIEEYAYDSDPK